MTGSVDVEPVPGDSGDLAAVVLAAGAGTRLRPLTNCRPKALCPVGNRSLLERALDLVAALTRRPCAAGHVAVNAHHHADLVVAAVAGRAKLSVEQPQALGTAGAVGALRGWLAGRAVLTVNADAYHGWPGGAPGAAARALLDGWDGQRPRLAVVADPDRADFPGGWRYAGFSLLPAAAASALPATPAGLYEVCWRAALAAGRLELFPLRDSAFVDCGRPADYLAANLHASGGASTVGEGAVVLGRIERCVVWPGGYVGPAERLSDCIRVGSALTVPAAAG